MASLCEHPQHASPAGPVWLPLLPGWATGRVALCSLNAAQSDPWRDCAEEARTREQATRAREPPPWPGDPDDDHDWARPAPAA